MAVSVAPRRNPRLISSRSGRVSRPGPGDQVNGLTVRVGDFIITFHAVWRDEIDLLPDFPEIESLRLQSQGQRSLFGRQMWLPHLATSSVS
jgi:hypothetical protein